MNFGHALKQFNDCIDYKVIDKEKEIEFEEGMVETLAQNVLYYYFANHERITIGNMSYLRE